MSSLVWLGGEPYREPVEYASTVAQVKGKRRGQGEDSIYWDASKTRHIGAVSLAGQVLLGLAASSRR